MTVMFSTNPDTRVRSLSVEPPRSAKPLAAVPASNTRTAVPLWTPPPPAKLVVEDEAAHRSALADCLAALDGAQKAELGAAARVSLADREQVDAKGRYAAAVEKTAAARGEAASAMQTWLASQDTDRPSSEALSTALAVEAAAKVDVEVVEQVLDGLKVEHEAAISKTKRVLREAEAARYRVMLAVASRMAAEKNELDECSAELGLSLQELFLTLPVTLPVPAGIRDVVAPKNVPFNVSSDSPGVRRWSKLITDLLADPQATVAPLGD